MFPIVTEPEQIQSTDQACTAEVTVQNLSDSTEYTVVFAQLSALNEQEQLYQKVYDSSEFPDLFGTTQLPLASQTTASIVLDRNEAGLGTGPLDVSLLLVGAQFREIAYFAGQWECE